jgi:hypothetical protein
MTAALGTNPVQITSTSTTLQSLTIPSDLSQVITRSFREGGGSNALAEAAVGDTFLAVEDLSWYDSSLGGLVRSGPQLVSYTGVSGSSGGAFIGPGVAPSAALSVEGKSGSGVTAGAHDWAYTYVTASGESLPAPVRSATMRTLTTPGAVDSVANLTFGTILPGGETFTYKMSVSTGLSRVGESTLGSGTSVVNDGHYVSIKYTVTLDMIGLYVNLYRDDDGAGYFRVYASGLITVGLVGTVVTVTDVATGATSAPVSGGNTIGQAALSAIAVGPSGTTSRKVYRTVAAGSQLKLLTTIADNTTTVLTDSTADGSLGANAPTSDTSGLTPPTGQVNAGSTSLLTSGAGAFSSTGGWAMVANGQAIRYTGISSNTLTGIPASGTGAILSTLNYGSSVIPAPSLIGIPSSGVGSIVYTIKKGEQVNLLIQEDDATAQGVIAALIGGTDDGVIEDYQPDGRISELEAIARATETLAIHGTVDQSLSGASLDNNMRGGRTLAINITAPTTVNTSFAIQSVTTSNFQTAIFPTRSFNAADVNFGFTDLIRLMRTP